MHYFEIMNKNNDILDKLKPYATNRPFEVPEGYFESLEGRIMQRVVNEKTIVPKSKVRSITIWFSAVAAVVVILFALQVWIHLFEPQKIDGKMNVYAEMQFDLGAMDFDENELILAVAKNQAIDIKSIEIDYVSGVTADDLETLVLF